MRLTMAVKANLPLRTVHTKMPWIRTVVTYY
uniref:Uncharacterized protein n=1 Tax=Arundo donax TaxID=35708 RepID=A0A0A8YVJ4_ARUDO